MAADLLRVIGLMSGTSADGVDAALLTLRGNSSPIEVEILAHATYPYEADLRAQILAASYPHSSSVDLICHLNAMLGHRFADAACAVVEAADLSLRQVHLIGSHGQTIYHIPQAITNPPRLASTLQIGEPCIIAERTGITTVADFRPRDMAAGGLGAPLSPYGHHVLFARQGQSKLIQNIGGIGNVTVLTGESLQQTIAFDTGPGNMLIDEAVRHFTKGRQAYDCGGQMAASGKVHAGLLDELMQHPFITQAPPKATGRETFGAHFCQHILSRGSALGLAAEDVVATCTAFSAESIWLNYSLFIFNQWPIAEVVVCGGGAENPVLMQMLAERLPASCRISTPETYGYPNAALEAMLFALLAHATIFGLTANMPATTGTRHPTILGKIIPVAGSLYNLPNPGVGAC
jgi:anhydro-N-acetylmuramic acid kinase